MHISRIRGRYRSFIPLNSATQGNCAVTNDWLDLPLRATITLEMTSGMLVPAASRVIPATESGTPSVYAMIVTIQTAKYETPPIQTTDKMKVSGNQRLSDSLRQSGTVKCSRKLMGQKMTQRICQKEPSVGMLQRLSCSSFSSRRHTAPTIPGKRKFVETSLLVVSLHKWRQKASTLSWGQVRWLPYQTKPVARWAVSLRLSTF